MVMVKIASLVSGGKRKNKGQDLKGVRHLAPIAGSLVLS